MQFSTFGQKFTGDSGILRLMDDLGQAAQQPGTIMLGGGNPSHIPQMNELFRQRMGRILDSEYNFERLIASYSAPEGEPRFIAAFVELMRDHYGWAIGPQNVALTNGSQTAFFFLFNLFAGDHADGVQRKILLPLAPEYIGYADAGIHPDIFVSCRPQIEEHPDRMFKYRVDFDTIEVGDDVAAICVSRPTNPTGNVLTEDEIAHLSALARQHEIPLIVDNAYGMPFPGIIFTKAAPIWEPHVVTCMSLSKLGLPGARTGIVVAHERIARALTGMNAVISLAPSAFGAALALDLIETGEIIRASEEIVRPHYRRKAQQTVQWFHEVLEGTNYHIHEPEGAFFLWLWFEDLPIPCAELYQRLKDRGVVVVPGHYFFPGLRGEWHHRHECIRVSYAGDDEQVRRGVAIIGEEVQRAYGVGRGV